MELLKLNVGCGFDHREGYVNVDLHARHQPDLVCEATCLKPIEDGSCAEVVAQDVLEHIHRGACGTALREWNRVLVLGGRLWIRVPSLLHLLHLLEDENWQGFERQQELIQCLYGTGAYEGDFHLNGFTEATLRHCLADAGFEISSIGIRDGWLFEVEARKVSERRPDPLVLLEPDEEFVAAAFRAIVGREADRGTVNYYLGVMRSGMPRAAVLVALIDTAKQEAREVRR